MISKNIKTLKGFLHKTPQGTWILAPRADLQSCCLHGTGDQIVLEGDFSPSRIRITVTGILETDGERQILRSAIIEKEPQGSFPFLMIFCVVLGIYIFRKSLFKFRR